MSRDRLRLCFVTREYPPVTPYSGGIGSHFAVLAPELGRQGHEVHVVTYGEAVAGPVTDTVELHLLRSPRPRLPRQLANLTWSFAVDRAVRALGPFDVVYAAEWGGDAWRYSRHRAAGRLVTNLTSSYLVVIEESDRRGSFRSRAGLATQGTLERRQAERSDAIVTCSSALLERLRASWDIERIPTVVLPNAVDLARTRSLATGEPPAEFPSSGPVVAFSGRLQILKGVRELVAAMRTVWASRPEVHLVLVGADGHGRRRMADDLRGLAGPHASQLHLLGHQPAERLFPALAAADIVALPSRWESFPLAGLEAMALGRPMVVTSGSGFAEFFESGTHGLMVPPCDPPSLARAIEDLLADDELRRRCSAAAAATAERYDAPIVARQHAAYFELVAAGAASSRG